MLALAAMLALTAATDPRVELLRADSLWRAGIASGGFVPATAARLAPDAVLVWPGAPVIERAETIGRFLAAQPGLDSLALGWSPERSWLSAAGDFGVVYGRTTSGRAGGPRGLVLAAWARDGREWRLAALLLVGIGAPAGAVLPQGMGPLTHPAVAGAGRLQPLADADAAFAADAGRRGAATAFEAWAAPDAVILGGPEPTLGPAAIGRAFATRPASRWTWHPVAVRGSADGDLGITVGEAIITPVAQPDAPNYSKYLTVWARQPDGSVRYLTDGGNPRPRP